MKKLFLCAVVAAVCNISHLSSKIVSIDSIKILKESDEGKQLFQDLENKAREIQKRIRETQQDFMKLQEEVSKETALKSGAGQEELAKKTQELQRKKRLLEQTIAAEEQEFNDEAQSKQIALSNKQRNVYRELKKEHNDWDIVLDVNTPGLFAIDENNDVTATALKVVNDHYQAELGRQEITAKKDVTFAANDDKTKITKVDAATLTSAIKKQTQPKTA